MSLLRMLCTHSFVRSYSPHRHSHSSSQNGCYSTSSRAVSTRTENHSKKIFATAVFARTLVEQSRPRRGLFASSLITCASSTANVFRRFSTSSSLDHDDSHVTLTRIIKSNMDLSEKIEYLEMIYKPGNEELDDLIKNQMIEKCEYPTTLEKILKVMKDLSAEYKSNARARLFDEYVKTHSQVIIKFKEDPLSTVKACFHENKEDYDKFWLILQSGENRCLWPKYWKITNNRKAAAIIELFLERKYWEG